MRSELHRMNNRSGESIGRKYFNLVRNIAIIDEYFDILVQKSDFDRSYQRREKSNESDDSSSL